jgi:hypothetical protein
MSRARVFFYESATVIHKPRVWVELLYVEFHICQVTRLGLRVPVRTEEYITL